MVGAGHQIGVSFFCLHLTVNVSFALYVCVCVFKLYTIKIASYILNKIINIPNLCGMHVARTHTYHA